LLPAFFQLLFFALREASIFFCFIAASYFCGTEKKNLNPIKHDTTMALLRPHQSVSDSSQKVSDYMN